jgi:hypothetical protein
MEATSSRVIRCWGTDSDPIGAPARPRRFDVTWAYEYAGDEELGRLLVAPGGMAVVVGPEREPALRAAIVEALAPCRTPAGAYRLANEWHFLIAYAGAY